MPVSIDTTKAVVARAALDAGAAMVNDVSGGTADPDMLRVVADAGAAYVAMHIRGTPRTMQQEAHYTDVVREVATSSGRGSSARSPPASTRARCSPIPASASPRPPSTMSRCCARCPRSRRASAYRCSSARRASRSSRGSSATTIGAGRDDATLATTVWCFEQGAALVRVHDVAGSRRAVELLEILERATPEGMAA